MLFFADLFATSYEVDELLNWNSLIQEIKIWKSKIIACLVIIDGAKS